MHPCHQMMKLRIAFVTSEYVTEPNFDGGLANYIHRVSLALLERGHHPIVVIPTNETMSFANEGIEVHRIDNKMNRSIKVLNRILCYRYHSILKYLRRSWISNIKIKELHHQQPLSLVQYPHIEGIGFFRLRRIPSIIRISSHTFTWKKYGGYAYLDTHTIRQQELFERMALKRVDAIYSPSNIMAEAFRQDLKKKVHVIESPFVLDQPADPDLSLLKQLSGKEYLLFFGALNELKGLIVIAKMIRRLLENNPSLHFVFVGKQNSQYQGMEIIDYVRMMAGEHDRRIIYMGKLPHRQLYPILEHAAAVVLPSLVDNFPNTCLEAMAHRRVVVGTQGASFEQLIEDGVNGFLCEKGNPESLLITIEKALSLSDITRNKIGKKASARIERLRPEIAATKLEAFYEEVIASRQRSTIRQISGIRNTKLTLSKASAENSST